jgi:hypothetical protein
MNTHLATALITAAVLALGIVIGANLKSPQPAYGQFGSSPGVFIEELEDDSEETKTKKYFGETYALITPEGNTRIVRISWERDRVKDDEAGWAKRWDKSITTFQAKVLDLNR